MNKAELENKVKELSLFIYSYLVFVLLSLF